MSFSELLRKNLRFVIVLPILVAGVVLVVSLFREPLYKSSVSLMVVQKQAGQVDANAAVQSAEQMADILSRIVDSETFRSSVLASGGVNVSLPAEPWKAAKSWRKIVKTRNITDTGILVIDVYQPTSASATSLASAVERAINAQAHDYLGVNPDSVVIRELNPPAPAHSRPATPNLPLNAAVGFLFGIIVCLSLVLLFPNVSWSQSVPLPFTGRRRQKTEYSPGYFVEQTPDLTGGLMYSEKLTQAINHEPDLTDEEPSGENLAPIGDLVSRANEFVKKRA